MAPTQCESPVITIPHLASGCGRGYILGMREIDLEPKAHSHRFELKPMSRWWLVLVGALCLLALFNNGLADWRSWSLLGFGVMLGFAVIFVFPKTWLSRID